MPRGVYPRKKKAAAAAKKVVQVARPVQVVQQEAPDTSAPNVMRLDELTLLRLGKSQAEVRAASSEILLKRGLKESILAKVDPQGVLKKLDAEIHYLTSRLQESQHEYEGVKKEIEGRYGIDMTKYAFDDRTGVLHDLSIAPQSSSSKEVLPEQSLPTEKNASVQ